MNAPISALTAARFMCERSGGSITNLELQKMLYLAQMFYLGQNNERLFSGAFEAWDFGPVLPNVYHQVKAFGRGPIAFVIGGGSISDSSREKMLAEAYDELSQMTPGQLVNITHWSKGAWAKHYRPGQKGVKIPDDDIRREYADRIADSAAA
jgi:uncharacterized phage-associated protein